MLSKKTFLLTALAVTCTNITSPVIAGGVINGPRIEGIRISYCTVDGCDAEHSQQAANAVCEIAGYGYATGYRRYKSSTLRKARKSVLQLTGRDDETRVLGWRLQGNKRRWFKSITCFDAVAPIRDEIIRSNPQSQYTIER